VSASTILVAGESLIDLIVRPDGSVSAHPGGGPYNAARTVARLGGRCAYLGVLSDDRFGRRLHDALLADGVLPDALVPTDLPTTLAVAELDERGAASYRFYFDGTSAPSLTRAELSDRVPADVAAFHVGTLGLVLEPTAATLEALAVELSARTLVLVDPNCRPAVIRDRAAYGARLDRVLACGHVVKVSDEDLGFLSPGVGALDAARSLLGSGPSVVLLTAGSDAVHVLTARGEVSVPVPRVAVVDTVGAGDSFGGAFVTWWVEHGLGVDDLRDTAALERAARFAVTVAGITCTRAGADPPWRRELGPGA
jgi:fructokinase